LLGDWDLAILGMVNTLSLKQIIILTISLQVYNKVYYFLLIINRSIKPNISQSYGNLLITN